MTLIMYAEKALMISDEAAGLAIEYADVLSNHSQADTVKLDSLDRQHSDR